MRRKRVRQLTAADVLLSEEKWSKAKKQDGGALSSRIMGLALRQQPCQSCFGRFLRRRATERDWDWRWCRKSLSSMADISKYETVPKAGRSLLLRFQRPEGLQKQ